MEDQKLQRQIDSKNSNTMEDIRKGNKVKLIEISPEQLGVERVRERETQQSFRQTNGDAAVGRSGVLVRPSNRLISRSSLSIPACPKAPPATDPRQPCLSKR